MYHMSHVYAESTKLQATKCQTGNMTSRSKSGLTRHGERIGIMVGVIPVRHINSVGDLAVICYCVELDYDGGGVGRLQVVGDPQSVQ